MSDNKERNTKNNMVLMLAIMQSVQNDFNSQLIKLCKQYNDKMDKIKLLMVDELDDEDD